MRFQVLGPLRVRAAATWTPVRAGQQRVVLAVLLSEAGRAVDSGRLVDEIWGERPPPKALRTVQGYVFRLRQLLGDGPDGPLVTRGHGYELRLADGDLDAHVFDRLVGTARRRLATGGADEAVEHLTAALALWRGPAMDDVPPSVTVSAEVARLELARLDAVEERQAALLRLGRHADVAAEAPRWAERHPLRERLWEQLMLALVRCGRRGEALETYRRARRLLVDDLGLEPSQRLRVLQQAILDGTTLPDEATPPGRARPDFWPTATATGRAGSAAAGGAATGSAAGADQPATASPTGGHGGAAAGRAGATTGATSRDAGGVGGVPAQLPADPAAFTGREVELRRLDELASAGAVATIGGTAGVGKTAMAVRWAHRVRDRFPDGQLFVNLRGYAAGQPLRPLDALARLLRGLGVPAQEVPVDVDEAAGLYRSLLSDRRVLVLLDNANHADQVRPLLPASPGCRVLVTTRDRLTGLVATDGAVGVTLDVLAPQEARRLLARLLGHRAADRDAVAEVAALCGHLPLALRLAAAHLTVRPQVTVAGYAARLRGDRLGALQVPDDPQAGVRSAFDQSYAVLPDDARAVFRLLGLVPGQDVTPTAVAALADLPPTRATAALDRLAMAHLVDEHQDGRFTMHDLLRHYAADRATATDDQARRDAATRRLLDHYLDHVDAAASLLYPQMLRLPRPTPRDQAADADGQARDQTGETSQTRAAGEAGQTGHRPAVGFDDDARAAAWLDAERANLVAAIVAAAEAGPAPSAWHLADALRGYLYLRMHTVDWLTAATAGLAAAKADGDPAAQAAGHISLASLHWVHGRHRQAIDEFTAAAEFTTAAGWLEGESTALGNLGAVYGNMGQHDRAVEYGERALAIDRRTGNSSAQAIRLTNLGLVNIDRGRLTEAVGQFTEAVTLYRRAGSRSGEARTLANLGEAHYAMGHLDAARDALTTALALQREIGDRHSEADTMRVLAAVHLDTGRTAEAHELAATAVTIAEETGERRAHAYATIVLANVHRQLGDHRSAMDGHRRAIAMARDMDERLVETDALICLAADHQHAGLTDQARAHAEAALSTARDSGYRLLEVQASAVLAALTR